MLCRQNRWVERSPFAVKGRKSPPESGANLLDGRLRERKNCHLRSLEGERKPGFWRGPYLPHVAESGDRGGNVEHSFILRLQKCGRRGKLATIRGQQWMRCVAGKNRSKPE